MQRDAAETLALRALGWIAGSEELMPQFLGATGASLDEVRTRAGDADFLAAVMDFLMMDDAWVTGAAAALGVRPEELARARDGLPGGGLPNWT